MGKIEQSETSISSRGCRSHTANTSISSLTIKYQRSWHNFTPKQLDALCNRFGLTFTNKDDMSLLAAVSQKQDAEYDVRFSPVIAK